MHLFPMLHDLGTFFDLAFMLINCSGRNSCHAITSYENSLTSLIYYIIIMYGFCYSIFDFFCLQYDCYNAPLNVDNTAYAWWTDRHDHTHTYWSGDGDQTEVSLQKM